MDWAGTHIGYVVASYGVTAIALIVLAGFVVGRDRRLKQELARLEAETGNER